MTKEPSTLNLLLLPNKPSIIPEEEGVEYEAYVVKNVNGKTIEVGQEINLPTAIIPKDDHCLIAEVDKEAIKIAEEGGTITRDHLKNEHKGIGVYCETKGLKVQGPRNVYTAGLWATVGYLFIPKKLATNLDITPDYTEELG